MDVLRSCLRGDRARLRGALFLGSVLLCMLPVRAQSFEAILWRHGGPRLDAALAKILKDAGLTAVSVDGAEDPAAMRALGLRFYLDHAAGKGTLHLRKSDFDAARKRYLEERAARQQSLTLQGSPEQRAVARALLMRPHALLDSAVMSAAAALVGKRAKRALRQSAFMVSLDDEISTTSFINPMDWCYAPSTMKAMRLWLQARYGGLERLNRAWATRFETWAQVVPPTTDAVRAREFVRDWPRRLTAWAEQREFMDIVLARAVGRLAATSRRAAPGLPVGIEGGQLPSAFGGYDWSRLLAQVDWVEPYNMNGLRSLLRSWRRPGSMHFETLFPGKNAGSTMLSVAQLWDAYAHALSGVIVWSSGRFFEKHAGSKVAASKPAQLSAYGRALARELPKLRRPRASWLVGAETWPGDIVVLESQASVRLHWMLDSRPDGKSWPKRLSSYERTHSTSVAARHSWVRLLQDLGYAFRFVRPADLGRERMGGKRRPRALILPSMLALSEQEIAAIRRFAELGGLVIADETPARYSRALVLRRKPALDAFFGIAREGAQRQVLEGKALPSAQRLPSSVALCESGLAPEGLTIARRVTDAAAAPLIRRGLEALGVQRHAGESWCQFERNVGKGRAVLLNLAVMEYASQRLERKHARATRDLRSRVRGILTAAGLRETCLVRIDQYPTILERQVYAKAGRQILVVRANCLENPALLRELVERGPQKMTLVLPMAARLRDLFTGEAVGRAGRRIQATLDPLRGSYFVIEAL